MNASTIIEILEPLASVTWWRVLVRQSAELARLRCDANRWRAIAHKAAIAGDDPTRDQAFADESDRQAETHERLTNGAWSAYWTAAREIRENFPSLMESLPIADGIHADEIDPQAGARAVQGLIGKLLSVESGEADPWVPVDMKHGKRNRSTFSGHANNPSKYGIRKLDHGKYEIRRSRLPYYIALSDLPKYDLP